MVSLHSPRTVTRAGSASHLKTPNLQCFKGQNFLSKPADAPTWGIPHLTGDRSQSKYRHVTSTTGSDLQASCVSSTGNQRILFHLGPGRKISHYVCADIPTSRKKKQLLNSNYFCFPADSWVTRAAQAAVSALANNP